MSNTAFLLICSISILLLIGAAKGLSTATAPERKKCIEAGYEWSPTKYACVVKLKK